MALTKISKKQSEKDLKMIVEILNNTDLSKKDVLNEIAKNKLYEISKLENDKIELEKIYLVFEKDKFKKIENKMNLSYE